MEYLLCNFSIEADNLLEGHIDKKIFKEMAFNSKIGRKLSGKKNLHYNYILIPLVDEQHEIDAVRFANVTGHVTATTQLDSKEIFSLVSVFEVIYEIAMDAQPYSIDIIGRINDDRFNIFYSDGSFKKSENKASYGVCQLLEKDLTGMKDDLTEESYTFSTHSGSVEEGTNNIGELSGLKKAINLFGDKDYQIIISDSEYSIKAFREWYYTWKDNNFRNYAKKPIANKELIKSIYDDLQKSDKIVLFKWVKGHSTSPFNEECDRLAKKELKIKKK